MPSRSLSTLAIGDWVHVKIKWHGAARGISVVSGTIVEEDDRCWGYQQFKLDIGMWFCPQRDEIMEHKPREQM